jgi:hypothetical protein
VPVDFTGVYCGLLVWLVGTAWVVAAIRRARASRGPTDNLVPGRRFEGPPVPLALVALAVALVMFGLGVAVVVAWDLAWELLLRARR